MQHRVFDETIHMRVEHYDTCTDCGSPLAETTVYRRHAYCQDCGPSLA